MSLAVAPRGSRFASVASKPPARKGRKGHLYGVVDKSQVTPTEQVNITRRRIEKAERDERIDIALSLTPVKTCVARLCMTVAFPS
jgi:hypothetical protein